MVGADPAARHVLRPYTWKAGLVVVLLMVQAIGNLYRPNLTGDVINNGVAKGDIGYIWRTGGVMLGIVFVLGVLAVVTGTPSPSWSWRSS